MPLPETSPSRRPKKWPTVANRHRMHAIDRAGDIKVEARNLAPLLKQLDEAVKNCNIPLARAIKGNIQGRIRLIAEIAGDIQSTLENAPLGNDE